MANFILTKVKFCTSARKIDKTIAAVGGEWMFLSIIVENCKNGNLP